MKKDILIILGLAFLVIALLIAGSFWQIFPKTQLPTEKTKVQIGNLKILAEIANTPAKRSKGLSGRTKLAEDEGMLFVFDRPDRYAFWMKDITIPLDFIWIDEEKRVADITPNAQPEPQKPKAQLRIYKPAIPVRYVLEVNAGLARKNDLKIGQKAEFQLP